MLEGNWPFVGEGFLTLPLFKTMDGPSKVLYVSRSLGPSLTSLENTLHP
jgi:hypothetical protein